MVATNKKIIAPQDLDRLSHRLILWLSAHVANFLNVKTFFISVKVRRELRLDVPGRLKGSQVRVCGLRLQLAFGENDELGYCSSLNL